MTKSYQHIVVTGATSGIGRQLALDYAEKGLRVTGLGRDQEALSKLSESGIGTAQVDVTKPEEVKAFFDQLDKVDLLILVAGNCIYMDALNYKSDVVQKMLDVNVMGISHCIEYALPLLKASKGHIVGVGSASAYAPLPRAEGYGASKACIHYLLRTLAISLKPAGVKVTMVAPGFVDTPLTRKNDFPMPFKVSVEEASNYIQRGIERGNTEIEFPLPLILSVKSIGLLPTKLFSAIWHRIYDPSKREN